VELGLSPSWEEHRLRMFENRVTLMGRTQVEDV